MSILALFKPSQRKRPPPSWIDFCLPKKISDINWDRFVAMVGEKELMIIEASDGEDSQGCWVQHRIAISPQGIDNLNRCAWLLNDHGVSAWFLAPKLFHTFPEMAVSPPPSIPVAP